MTKGPEVKERRRPDGEERAEKHRQRQIERLRQEPARALPQAAEPVVEDPDADAPPDPSHLFRLEISELSVVALANPRDHLVIESWHEGRGVTSRRR